MCDNRMIYVRLNISTPREIEDFYSYWEELNYEGHREALKIHDIFWVEYPHGWAVYATRKVLKKHAPTLYKWIQKTPEKKGIGKTLYENRKKNPEQAYWIPFEECQKIRDEARTILTCPEFKGTFMIEKPYFNKEDFITHEERK